MDVYIPSQFEVGVGLGLGLWYSDGPYILGVPSPLTFKQFLESNDDSKALIRNEMSIDWLTGREICCFVN